MHRRTLTLGICSLLAGCAGAGGDAGTPTDAPPIRATAAPATLAPATRDATGYAEERADSPPLNTSVTARIEGDVTLQTTREVRATTARRVYVRSTPDGPAVVGLHSIPGVQPFQNADLEKNPAVGVEPAERIGRAQSIYADPSDLSTVTERSVTILGVETALVRYRGTATTRADDADHAVAAAVGTAPHAGDYVTVVVVTPRDRDAPLARLLDGVRHGEK